MSSIVHSSNAIDVVYCEWCSELLVLVSTCFQVRLVLAAMQTDLVFVSAKFMFFCIVLLVKLVSICEVSPVMAAVQMQ